MEGVYGHNHFQLANSLEKTQEMKYDGEINDVKYEEIVMAEHNWEYKEDRVAKKCKTANLKEVPSSWHEREISIC